MMVFLNGHFVSEEQACVSVFDRGFLYGDGLFETLRVLNGKPFRFLQHFERLIRGMAFLKLQLPFSFEQLSAFADELIRRNQMPGALLRLTVSRGTGPRGYSIRSAGRPTVLMSLHSASDIAAAGPQTWRLVTSSVRLPTTDPLAQFKTCNKLPQIIALTEADAVAADEALLLNTEGWAVEGSRSNLFWLEKGSVCTAPLSSGVLPGVTRAVVLELCHTLGLHSREASVKTSQLLESEGIFLTLSSLGIITASHLDHRPLQQPAIIGTISAAYSELLRFETQR